MILYLNIIYGRYTQFIPSADPSIFQVGGLINRGDSKLKPIHYEERKTFTYNAYNTLKSKIKK